jgi:hypothetical protein
MVAGSYLPGLQRAPAKVISSPCHTAKAAPWSGAENRQEIGFHFRRRSMTEPDFVFPVRVSPALTAVALTEICIWKCMVKDHKFFRRQEAMISCWI